MLLAAALAGAWSTAAVAGDVGPRPPGQFDLYVLSLSWAQGYCDVTAHPDPSECSHVKGFLLHGLWPQLNGGDWPSNCSNQALPSAERARSQGLYASPSLITHEWSKHGTCSGLAPAAYFDLTRADVAKVQIPAAYRAARKIAASEADALRRAFAAANPGATTDGLQVVAAKGEITEVDVCLTRNGVFRSC
jgi:ribonuclease T2